MTLHSSDHAYAPQSTSIVPERCYFKIRLRGQAIGLPVECVKTVFHVDRLTPVPLAPKEVAGLVNLRGRIVTVLHLDRCLWLDEAGDMVGDRLAVGVENDGEDYALLIDATDDVVTIGDDAHMDCPAHIDRRLRDLLSGCYRADRHFLSILDVGALLRRVNRSSEQSPGASGRNVALKGAGR